jgi:predicted enzyme related to lactoylglutathione lyase
MTEQSSGSIVSASSPVANPFSWCDIEVADLKQAESFYGAVFGWEFVPFGEDFAMATKDGALVCGLMKADGPVAGRGLRGYIATDDLEGTLQRVEAAGGSVAKARGEIGGGFGWWATFGDPSGVVLGLATDKPAT